MLHKVVVLRNFACRAKKRGNEYGRTRRVWGEKQRTKDDVGTIEPPGDDGGDEELRSVGILSCVRHGEDSRLGVLELEVLVCSEKNIPSVTHILQNQKVRKKQKCAEIKIHK